MSLISFLMIKNIKEKEESDDEPEPKQKLSDSLLKRVARQTAKSLLRLDNEKPKMPGKNKN